ncbi:MAG: hypothetical protein KAJ30_08970 [Candidatus Heimdallarchaeota archaeon]|nr:hypothetical protein [Candidatus Heimdallarchaeota archaeon]
MITEKKEDSGIKKFKWWVTPLNLVIMAGFLAIIDYSVGNPPRTFDWVYWPALGFLLIYILNIIVVRRPELAWFVGRTFFLLLSIYLLIIDLAYGPNDLIWFLDWSPIPIGALLTFGTIIPIIVQLGKKKMRPRKRLEELEKKRVIQEENEKEKSENS